MVGAMITIEHTRPRPFRGVRQYNVEVREHGELVKPRLAFYMAGLEPAHYPMPAIPIEIEIDWIGIQINELNNGRKPVKWWDNINI